MANTRTLPSYLAMLREKLRMEPTADNLLTQLSDDVLTSCLMSARGRLETNHPLVTLTIVPIVTTKTASSFTLPPVGSQNSLDITQCLDATGIEVFRDIIDIREVAYPLTSTTLYIDTLRRNFTFDGTFLFIDYSGGLAISNSVGIVWGKKHTFTDTTNTIPAKWDETLVLGGLAFAYSYLSDYRINTVNLGAGVAPQYANTGAMRMAEFESLIVAPTRKHKDFLRG